MRFFVFVILLLMVGCDFSDSEPVFKEQISNQVMGRVAAKMKKERDLYACGFGGQAMDKVEMLYLSFIYYKSLDMDESREILLYVVNQFIDEVNNEKRIHRFLGNYPFVPENIEVAIVLKNLDGSDFSHEKLCLISMYRGCLEYNVGDPITDRLLTIHKETYEEALQIIEKKAELVALPL